MKDNNISIKNLFALVARQNEVIKRVKNGGLNINDALVGTQGILDKVLLAKQDRFPQFAHLLRPLSVQAQELLEINKKMPKGMRVPDFWFDDLDTNSKHVQMIEDLEFFFIVPPGNLKEVIEYQVMLVELTQPDVWRASDFNSDIEVTYLDETADEGMFGKCGIHRRRINLVSYWDLKNGSTVDQARQRALSNGVSLAGLAAIGAYAAQDPALYRLQDGYNLPYFDTADLRSGDDGSRAFYSHWSSNDCRVDFNSCNSNFAYKYCARPSFI